MNVFFKLIVRLKWWLGAGLIALIVLWFAQQIIFKPIIETVASQTLGARVTLGSFSLNVLTRDIRITNLEIYNEEGFPAKVFFSAPEIFVRIDLAQALKGKLHFPLIIFHLDKMIVFKNAQGKMNVNELKIVQSKLHDKTKAPPPNFKIDELQLSIGQVIMEDDSKTPPWVEAYDVNIQDKTIHDVNGVSKLVGLVMFEALKPTAIQSAGLYAATTLLGIGFLPGLAIGVAIANDKADAELHHPFDQVYQHCLGLLKRLGKIKREDPQAGEIFAKVYDCDITVEVLKENWFQSEIIIKARKYFLPKPEIATGLLYQLKEEL